MIQESAVHIRPISVIREDKFVEGLFTNDCSRTGIPHIEMNIQSHDKVTVVIVLVQCGTRLVFCIKIRVIKSLINTKHVTANHTITISFLGFF